MTMKTIALASAAAIALSACATSADRYSGRNPYSATAYTSATQLYAADQYARLTPPAQRSANGAVLEAVSYEGIEGARRAHQRYTEEEAEQLDGRCERFISPTASESLIDIANLCDVSLDTLVAYNPNLKDISYVTRDIAIEIPGGKKGPKGTFAMSDALADLYVVGEGDTLDSVAYKLNVSTASLVSSNPNVQWTNLSSGLVLKRPVASTTPSAPSASYAPAAPAARPQWEGYSGARGIADSAAGGVVTPHAPYALKPVRSQVGGNPRPENEIEVDRLAVKAGDKVKVTARAPAGTDVVFYRGTKLGELSEVARERAGADGVASADIAVPKKADRGGVIFKAKPQGGDALYSERVIVVPAAPDDAAEEETTTEE